MSKRIALKDYIGVDGVDLSNFARSVSFSSEHAQVDVSGFNATGSNEFLAGQTTQSITVEFYGSYGTGEVHHTVYPLHRDRSTFDFVWYPDQSAAVSAGNPKLSGLVQALTYAPGATRGDAETFSVTFSAADETGLVFSDT